MLDIVYRFDLDFELPPEPETAEQARRRLEDGNRKFAELVAGAANRMPLEPHVIACDLAHVSGRAAAQEPFAVVLGCSDARVPTELVFGQAANDLFVVRVAGNVLGSECLGSIDYAMDHLDRSLRLVVVLGHSGCGAVTAAVDSYITPGQYLNLASSHSVRSIVDRITIAVRAASGVLETLYGRDVPSRPGYRKVLIEASVLVHVAFTAHTLQAQLAGRREVVFGVFDLVTHRVGLSALAVLDDEERLHAPPRDRDAFLALVRRVVDNRDTRAVLDGER